MKVLEKYETRHTHSLPRMFALRQKVRRRRRRYSHRAQARGQHDRTICRRLKPGAPDRRGCRQRASPKFKTNRAEGWRAPNSGAKTFHTAMGKQRGVTARRPEGQVGVLEKYGINEQSVGRDPGIEDVESSRAPARTREGLQRSRRRVRTACIHQTRVKPHTDLAARTTAGVMKMMVIGTRKAPGAAPATRGRRATRTRAGDSTASTVSRCGAPDPVRRAIVRKPVHDTAPNASPKRDNRGRRKRSVRKHAIDAAPAV